MIGGNYATYLVIFSVEMSGLVKPIGITLLGWRFNVGKNFDCFNGYDEGFL